MGPKDVLDSTLSIIEKYSTWRQLKKDRGAILRLLYLESKRNSSLLSCIKFDMKGASSRSNESEFNGIISALDTEILDLVFMAGKSSSRVFEFMKDSDDFETDDESGPHENENPLNALSFLYVRIWSIRKLVKLSRNTPLKKINYKVRIKNIQSAYLTLILNLEKTPEIRPLLRG